MLLLAHSVVYQDLRGGVPKSYAHAHKVGGRGPVNVKSTHACTQMQKLQLVDPAEVLDAQCVLLALELVPTFLPSLDLSIYPRN